jgi:hypothetical protein
MSEKYTREFLSDLLKRELIDIIIEMQEAHESIHELYQRSLDDYQRKIDELNRKVERLKAASS